MCMCHICRFPLPTYIEVGICHMNILSHICHMNMVSHICHMHMVSHKAHASFIFACDTWVHMPFPACVAVFFIVALCCGAYAVSRLCCSVLQVFALCCGAYAVSRFPHILTNHINIYLCPSPSTTPRSLFISLSLIVAAAGGMQFPDFSMYPIGIQQQMIMQVLQSVAVWRLCVALCCSALQCV